MSSLTDRLMKESKLTGSSVLSESTFFNDKDRVSTPVLSVNLAFSGELMGGITSGLTFLAGKSKTFKSLLGLLTVGSYLRKYDDAVCLFYDSEFGITDSYMKANGVDTSRVIHRPIKNVEELKFDVAKMLETIQRGEHVIIFIDSVGNLASKKEVEDALNENSAADLSRAKQLKSLFRIITPYLTMNNIPCVAINHTYDTIELHSKQVMGGGCMVADTKVTMADGTLANIQEVNTDDYVMTLDGPKSVTATWNPDTLLEGHPDCFDVEFEDGLMVTVSHNHRFLVHDGYERKWVEAKDLEPEMDIVSV